MCQQQPTSLEEEGIAESHQVATLEDRRVKTSWETRPGAIEESIIYCHVQREEKASARGGSTVWHLPQTGKGRVETKPKAFDD